MATEKRQQYLERLRQLIDGQVAPREVSEWAAKEEIDNPNLDEGAQEVLDSLQLSGALNEHGEPLYVKEDYEEWLADLLKEQ